MIRGNSLHSNVFDVTLMSAFGVSGICLVSVRLGIHPIYVEFDETSPFAIV